MPKPITIRYEKKGNDKHITVEPFEAHIDSTKQEAVRWHIQSPHTSEFRVEFPNSSPFRDGKRQFDHNSPESQACQNNDPKQHKYNVIVDGTLVDPIIMVEP